MEKKEKVRLSPFVCAALCLEGFVYWRQKRRSHIRPAGLKFYTRGERDSLNIIRNNRSTRKMIMISAGLSNLALTVAYPISTAEK